MDEKTMCNVKVAVRVRPLNRRGEFSETINFFSSYSYCFLFYLIEVELNTTCVVRMEDDQTIIHHPNESEGY